VLIYFPVIVVLATFGFSRLSLWLAFPLGVAGYLAWTLLEYWGHRLAFHHKPASAWGRRLHGVHHDDPKRLVLPPAGTVPVLGLLLAGMWLTIGGAAWACVGAGFIAGYLAYDMVHFWLHRGRPRGQVGKSLRRRHLRHHRQDQRAGFGVSAPYWDRVFGTSR
jgi:dihydroceramide fatty acyl 2-hydroxylase